MGTSRPDPMYDAALDDPAASIVVDTVYVGLVLIVPDHAALDTIPDADLRVGTLARTMSDRLTWMWLDGRWVEV